MQNFEKSPKIIFYSSGGKNLKALKFLVNFCTIFKALLRSNFYQYCVPKKIFFSLHPMEYGGEINTLNQIKFFIIFAVLRRSV